MATNQPTGDPTDPLPVFPSDLLAQLRQEFERIQMNGFVGLEPANPPPPSAADLEPPPSSYGHGVAIVNSGLIGMAVPPFSSGLIGELRPAHVASGIDLARMNTGYLGHDRAPDMTAEQRANYERAMGLAAARPITSGMISSGMISQTPIPLPEPRVPNPRPLTLPPGVEVRHEEINVVDDYRYATVTGRAPVSGAWPPTPPIPVAERAEPVVLKDVKVESKQVDYMKTTLDSGGFM